MIDDKKRWAYERAKKKVKDEKDFYSHLVVYSIVNSILLFINSDFSDEGFKHWFHWNTYITPIVWGIALAFHGLSVFGKGFIFSKEWEEKKIKEIMDNDTL